MCGFKYYNQLVKNAKFHDEYKGYAFSKQNMHRLYNGRCNNNHVWDTTIIENWDDIISKLPHERKRKIEEIRQEFDFLISLKKICKNKSPVNNVSYLPSKNLKYMGRLFAQSASPQNLPRELRGAIGANYHGSEFRQGLVSASAA